MSQRIAEAVKALVDALREDSPSDRVTFNLFVNYQEARVTTSERSPESLVNDGISMRNLKGEFIKAKKGSWTMTTTIELIDFLQSKAITASFHQNSDDENKFRKAAQRLRELDKPDCIFTMCADDSPTPNTLESSCEGAVLWYMGNPSENKLPKFCWHCGGAVKEST